jgi:hypothetical protein
MLLTYNTMRNANAAQKATNKVKKASLYSQGGSEILKANCNFQLHPTLQGSSCIRANSNIKIYTQM